MYGRGKVASLIQAILSKDDAMLAILLQDGKLAAYASSTSIFKNNISPLAKDNPTILIHIATKFGTAKAVEALLKKDTDNKTINARGKYNGQFYETPLLMAISRLLNYHSSKIGEDQIKDIQNMITVLINQGVMQHIPNNNHGKEPLGMLQHMKNDQYIKPIYDLIAKEVGRHTTET